MVPRRLAVTLVALALARPLAAQCPDGTPAPCRTAILPDSVVAVLPFRTVGSALALWGEGLVDLLAGDLDDAGGLHVVPPRRAIARLAGRPAVDPGAVIAAARSLGAGLAVTGSLVPTGSGRVRLLVATYQTQSARKRADASFVLNGADSDIGALADSAALLLFARLTRMPVLRVIRFARLPRTVDALRAFLAAERAVRDERFTEADSLYEQAAALDTSLALAFYRRFELRHLMAVQRPPSAQTLVARALAIGGRLSEREQLLLHAARRGREYLDSTDFIERREYVNRYPDDAEGWFWLEDWYWHAGAIYGVPLRRVVEAGERAIQNDSSFQAPYLHALWAAIRDGDSAASRRLLAACERSQRSRFDNFRLALRIRFAPVDSAGRLIHSLGRQPIETLGDLALFLPIYDPRIESVAFTDVMYRMLAERAGSSGDLSGYARRAELLAALGRFAAASAQLDTALALDSTNRAAAFAGALIITTGLAPDWPGRANVVAALRAIAGSASPRRSEQLAAIGFQNALARVAIQLDDTATAAAARAPRDRPLGAGAESASVALDDRDIEARLALRRGDTTAAIRLLESITRVADATSPWFWHRLDVQDQYLLATLYTATGQAARARSLLDRPERGWAGGGGVLGLKLLLLADLAAAAGDAASARQHYAEVVTLWKDGDAVVEQEVQRARAALARLGAR